MRKKVKKALVCAAAALIAAGLTVTAACSGNYKSDALTGDISGNVVSNGGFAVEKGNYIYFINGVESNTAVNSFGDVLKGSLVRISKENLAAGNYASVETVVPLIMYSGNYDGGIYIYGDYVYYSTPSAAKDSSGATLNSRLEFKRSKLDGSETMSGYYFQSENTAVDYRFVEVDGKVYLMYALSESLYGEEDAVSNIHSVNLETGKDTLLAYNVDSYFFDEDNLSNPYVYYTMNVTYNMGTSNAVEAEYNQIYRVCADAAEGDRTYDFSYIEDYDAKSDPVYVNLGEFVFDGIGALCDLTQFNYGYDPAKDEDTSSDKTNTLSGYTYEIVHYADGTLYYTRTPASNVTEVLLYTDDAEVGASSWNPVSGNPAATDNYGGRMLLLNGTSLSDYTFITDSEGKPSGVIYTDNDTLMSANFEGGSLKNEVRLSNVSGEVTILGISKETAYAGLPAADGAASAKAEYTFLYYGVTGEGNSYSVHRIALGGTAEDYEEFPADDSTSNYNDTRILDLDVSSGWYMPEIISGYFFFPSETSDMMDYDYVMAFDLRPEGAAASDDTTMSNAQIEEINDLYDSVMGEDDGVIAGIDSEDFKNLPNALRYAFYTRDAGYLDELIQMWEDEGEDEEYLYSTESAQMYKDFINAEGEYAEFRQHSKQINGETVYATSRDYYYNLVGKMTEEDAEDYTTSLRSDYMQAEPTEAEEGWFESLSTGAKVGFIIGVCVAGIIVIGAAVLIPLFIIRKKRKALPRYNKARIKVDTTDDKNIDVYAADDNPSEDNK